MNPQAPVTSCVKRRALDGKDMADALAALTTTCTAGAASPEVKSDPVSTAALADLTAKADAASKLLTAKQKVDQEAEAATTKLFAAFKLAKTALTTYETAVNGIAHGDASIISKAGCSARPEAPAATPQVSKVEKVTHTLGKNLRESVLHWPETPGAAMFTVEVNFDANSAAGPWTSLGTTTRRSKRVTVPVAGAQYLARITAMASDGTTADVSDTALATAR